MRARAECCPARRALPNGRRGKHVRKGDMRFEEFALHYLCFLYFETAAADEFADDGIAGDYAFVFKGAEVFEILDEAVCHNVLRVGRLDFSKGRKGLGAQYAKLVKQA